jgi:hypothetical protein
MRVIVIDGCDEEFCPYSKRISHYDYNDEMRCDHPDRDCYYGESLREFEENECGEILPANCGSKDLFPSDCPLRKVSVII